MNNFKVSQQVSPHACRPLEKQEVPEAFFFYDCAAGVRGHGDGFIVPLCLFAVSSYKPLWNHVKMQDAFEKM